MHSTSSLSLRLSIVKTKIFAVAATLLVLGTATSAQAASETWTPAAAGTYFWTNTADWSGSAAPGATGSTTNTDTATFGNLTGAETVTVDSGRNVQNIVITDNATSATYAYTFSGGPLILTAGGSILSNATGTTVTSATTFSDPITLEGTYSIINNSAGTGTTNELTMSGNITGATGLGGYTLTLGGSNVSTNTVSGIIAQGGTSGSPSTMSLVKSGAGTWILSATNSYTGTTTIDGGVLGVGVLANAGTNSSIGAGTTGATPATDIIINGGTLRFTGTTTTSGSTNRLITVGDSTGSGDTATFDNENANGSAYNATGAAAGLMNFTNAGAVTWGDTAAHTLTFTGLNLGNNTFALAIGDQGPLDPTGVGKSGLGTWVFTGANSYSGPTTITGGILRDGSGTGLSSNSLLVLNGGTFETGVSTFTRTLGSAPGNIEITGGASGLSANGGAVSATINNSGNPLQFGTSTFSPSTFILNAPTANNSLTLNDSLDLNGATQTIATYANTAIIDGSIINSAAGTAAGLFKAGSGTLVLNGASSSSYNGATTVDTGVLAGNTAGSLGAGNAFVLAGAELRLGNANALASNATVTLNNNDAILGESDNATQSSLASALTSNSTGVLAIDAAQSNALNMAALGNGAMYLGSVTGGAYSASSLGITSGGTELDSGGAPGGIATFGGYYLLGGGGGTLTITGQNVLTNQPASLLLSNYTGTTPSQSLLTSNNYNSLIVGDPTTAGQPNSGGTVDLKASQNYLGSTTVNAGSTLELDYSGYSSGTTNGNIISQYSPVNLNGGTLLVNGSTSQSDTQILGGVTSNLSASTIDVNSNGATGVTLNLGALSANTSATTLIENQTGSNAVAITTTTAPTNGTLSAQYVYDNNGTYTWVGATGSGPTYTVGAYTGDTSNLSSFVSGNSSATTDYFENGSVTTTAAESINLLRITGTGTNKLTIGTTTGQNLTVNGILDTESGLFELLNTGSLTASGSLLANNNSNNTIYFYNYGTGTFDFDTQNTPGYFTAGENAVFAGTGVFTTQFGAASGITGNAYLDGVTFQFNNGTPFFSSANELVINSGTTMIFNESSGGFGFPVNMQWNGNFTIETPSKTTTFSSNIVLTNNISLTVNSIDDGSVFDIIGNMSDTGYGYGLTISANSPSLSTAGQAALQWGASGKTTTSSFTGPINVLGDGLNLQYNGVTNRFQTLNMAPGTTVTLWSGTLQLAGLNDAGGAGSGSASTESINADSSAYTIQLWGGGNYSFGGVISQNGTNAGGLTMSGLGTQTLTGASTFTGGITANAGALIVDASKGGSIASQNLTLGGGTFEEIGASTGTTQTFDTTTATMVNAGQSKIVANSTYGTTTINLGALTLNAGGVLDIAPIGTSSTVTTTTANVANGELGSHVVFTGANGVTTWATAGTGVVATAITAYTGDTTALTASGTVLTTNYNLTGSLSGVTGESTGLIRISNTSVGTLTQNGGTTLTLGNGAAANAGGILYNGTAAYTITGGNLISGGTTDTELVIENYAGSGGSLTIASNIGNTSGKADALVLAGTGTTYLTGTNTYTGITYLDGGTVNFSSSANFSGSSNLTFSGGTLQYATGNTYDLTSKGATSITPNASGGIIDTNGNAVTWAANNFGDSGVGGLTFVDSYNAANPASATGVLNISKSATYTGITTIDNGGVVNLTGGVLNTAGGTVVGSGGTLEGGLTQATSSSQGTSSDYAGKLVLQSGGVVAPGAPGIGTTVNNGTNGGIQNAGVGGVSGGNNAGDQNQDVGFNVLSATQLQWYAGGTLKFYLDDTTTASSATAPAASTVLNLGLGALAKMGGTGQYILNFANTGGYNGATGKPNVYDLINFGSSVNTSLDPNAYVTTNGNPNGNTNFNVDDFTIENLNGIGVLSFYYNANADNGAGQEELLLTVIPEPSTWAMLIGGLATLIFWTRRKRVVRSLFRK